MKLNAETGEWLVTRPPVREPKSESPDVQSADTGQDTPDSHLAQLLAQLPPQDSELPDLRGDETVDWLLQLLQVELPISSPQFNGKKPCTKANRAQ